MSNRIFIQGKLNSSAINLLKNPRFKKGTDEPDEWTKSSTSLPGVNYVWNKTDAESGSHGVCIDIPNSGFGAWCQTVSISPSTFYVLSGYLKFENIIPPGYCNLQLVMRDAEGSVVKFVDFPSHTGTREFAYDFPRELTVLAPKDASIAEVNLFLNGPGRAWFDNIFFGKTPTGDISGVVSANGIGLEGVQVSIWDGSKDSLFKTTTDIKGNYVIREVPVLSPRYILLAHKQDYKTKAKGNIGVSPSETVGVDFELESGNDPLDDLRVKFGSLAHIQNIPSPPLPHDAIIDENLYPESVKPYLQPDKYVESDNPEIKKLASKILSSLPMDRRRNSYDVAFAVFTWISKNIEHDGIYYAGPGRPEHGGAHERARVEKRVARVNEHFKDITSGIWQTVTGEGWCWGHNFYDWCFSPTETLLEKGVICAEHAWLTAALLRALRIPTRSFLGANEFWLQTSSGKGQWVYMSTTEGRTGYRVNGSLDKGFGRVPPEWYPGFRPDFFSVSSIPLLHEDWYTENRCMFREIHPWREVYDGTNSGFELAVADLKEFKQTGEAPFRSMPPSHINSLYEIFYTDITVNLLNIGSQRELDVRFPFISESATHSYGNHEAYWTNHPECVMETWIEEVSNPPVEGKERWFHIKFNLESLL